MIAWRSVACVALMVLLAGCTGSEQIDSPSDTTEGGPEDPRLEPENETKLPIQQLSQENRFRLNGPGPAEIRLETNDTFTINEVTYYNPEGSSVDDLQFWILLAPSHSDLAGTRGCDDDPPELLFWHNQINGSGLFWEDRPAGEYTLAYGTPDGTHLEVEIQKEYSPGGESPDAQNLTTYPSSYNVTRLEPDTVESDSTGLGVHGSASLGLEAGNASMVYSTFGMNGIHVGPRTIESRFTDATGSACKETQDSANTFGLEVQLSTFMPTNATLEWVGAYEAQAGFNSNPEVRIVRVQW